MSIAGKIRRFADRLFGPVAPELVRVCVAGAVVLVLYRFVCPGRLFETAIAPWLRIGRDAFFGFGTNGFKGVSTFVVMGLAPLVFGLIADRRRPSALGLALGDWRAGLKWGAIFLAVMIPIVLAASYTGTFADKYPLARNAGDSIEAFAVYQLVMLLYFLGWEYFFRGYLLFSLHRHIGAAAVFVQMIPFAVLHGSKPLPEALGSIPVGLVLGVFALRTRTFLYCAAVHFLVALAMDLAAVGQRYGVL